MNEAETTDWHPLSVETRRDPPARYDWMREHQPVALSGLLGWSLFRHADVAAAAHDPITFSNAVSPHVAIPNGQDPPIHGVFRRPLDSFFNAAEMQRFEPVCRRVFTDTIHKLKDHADLEAMSDFARPVAARLQCAFLGWPDASAARLSEWGVKNQIAARANDREALAQTAHEFETFVDDRIAERRGCETADLTARLMQTRIEGRPLTAHEIASILRTWTVGEIGTIAASIGIVMRFLAAHPNIWTLLCEQPDRIEAACDEILRIDGPLLCNRRVTTRPVEVQGRRIEAGERVTLIWPAANRDGSVFVNPLEFRLDRDPSLNLLYGAGIHGCPGAPLARLELRVLIEELQQQRRVPGIAVNQQASRAVFPTAGFETLPIRLERK